MGPQATKWSSCLDIEYPDKAGEIRGGDEGAVAAEGAGGDNIGEGDVGGGRECLGGEESEGGGIGGGKLVWGYR